MVISKLLKLNPEGLLYMEERQGAFFLIQSILFGWGL